MPSNEGQPPGLPENQATVTPWDSDSVNVPTREAVPVAGPTRPAGAPSRIEPGQTLGKYRILSRLGAGGMGEVFKAVHQTMDRVVALKIMAPQLMQEARARARFQREVRSAARLAHPNIVIAHDADVATGHCFLVMEYVEGANLAHLVSQNGRPPVPLACEIVRQAALGLQHAHECGMVHRDIKPQNLMLVLDSPAAAGWPAVPRVKILDFGLARLVNSDSDGARPTGHTVTREGTVVGTPEFMSPEQATGSKGLDIRADVYSLGCTLYFLLAGRAPFVSASAYEVITKHLTDPPEPLNVRWPDVPVGLAAVVSRMLAKRPEERYQTPAEVANALLPWTGAGTPSAHSRTMPLAVSGKSAPVLPAAAPVPAPVPRPPPRYREPTGGLGEALRKFGLWLALVLVIASIALAALKFLVPRTGGDSETPSSKNAPSRGPWD
jgi:eukaryotic-like serine/threonine-protein kinase